MIPRPEELDQAASPSSRSRLAFQIYYIPLEAANAYPHRFAVRFSYTSAASPPGTGFLVVTQAAARLPSAPLIPRATRPSLGGTSSAVIVPGALTDRYDESVAAERLPAGSTISDTHSAQGQVFALETVGGGVLDRAADRPSGHPVRGCALPGEPHR